MNWICVEWKTWFGHFQLSRLVNSDVYSVCRTYFGSTFLHACCVLQRLSSSQFSFIHVVLVVIPIKLTHIMLLFMAIFKTSPNILCVLIIYAMLFLLIMFSMFRVCFDLSFLSSLESLSELSVLFDFVYRSPVTQLFSLYNCRFYVQLFL